MDKPMPLSDPAIEVGLGLTGALSAVAAFFGGQRTGRAEFINAVSKAADQVIARLQAECERVSVRCKELETAANAATDALMTAQAAHAGCEAQVTELKRRLARLESRQLRQR